MTKNNKRESIVRHVPAVQSEYGPSGENCFFFSEYVEDWYGSKDEREGKRKERKDKPNSDFHRKHG